jgi:hypothetical protein
MDRPVRRRAARGDQHPQTGDSSALCEALQKRIFSLSNGPHPWFYLIQLAKGGDLRHRHSLSDISVKRE